ncbi:hypothetical protein Ddye_032742 [Dipteronia dyeriana]|uniref:Uncharacterized protein n=1 Tax=Dipteronia dyeriana TaxID=168575 RepID=A0AAD9TBY9_9ROSI|nr:hypothetical protein Ddye_032742 [Dipteronia dyeriana]
MSSSSPTSPQNQPTIGVRKSKKCASHGKRWKAPREGTQDAGSPSKPSQPTCVELRMRDSNSSIVVFLRKSHRSSASGLPISTLSRLSSL